MRHSITAIGIISLLIPNFAEANHEFTVVLHARTPSGTGTCTASGLPNCQSIRPTTQIAAGADFRLYIFVNNFDNIAGIQTAFDWPPDWVLDPDGEPPATFSCRHYYPECSDISGPGPERGAYACFFDCFQGPALCVIARIDFVRGLEVALLSSIRAKDLA